LYLFLRLSTLAFTVLVPLLGAATGASQLRLQTLLGLIIIATAFHVFAYVLNDVADLWLDITEPLRSDSPLVCGIIKPRQALAIALVQVPFTLLVAVQMQADVFGLMALVTAFALMAVYNWYGKRCVFPILTDAVQALGWCALALYGATVSEAQWRPVTGILLGYIFVYILMINGVHGGLRDLTNDYLHEARTTAIWFGARPTSHANPHIPGRLVAYAAALQVSLVILSGMALVSSWLKYDRHSWLLSASLTLILNVAAVTLMVWASRQTIGDRHLRFAGLVHMMTAMYVLPALFFFSMDSETKWVVSILVPAYAVAMWAYDRSVESFALLGVQPRV